MVDESPKPDNAPMQDSVVVVGESQRPNGIQKSDDARISDDAQMLHGGGPVVLITNMIPPYRVAVFNAVARLLDDRFVVVTLARLNKGRQWQIDAAGYRFRHEPLPGVQIPLKYNRIIHLNMGLGALLKRLKPARIITSGFQPVMLRAFLHARLHNIPHIVMMDGGLHSDAHETTALHRLIRRHVVKRSAAGIGAGLKSLDWFRHYGLTDKQLTISPLVPAWQAPADPPGFDQRPFDILWCGTFNDGHKGILFFLEVIIKLKALCRERGQGLTVRLVGEGPHRQRLESAFREHGIPAQFDGFLQQDALIQAYRSARLFMMPSRYDAWGLVANEAALCATPVLVSKHAGVADDLIQDGINGYVLPLEADTWVDAALGLLGDGERWSVCSRLARKQAMGVTVARAAVGLVGVL